MSMAGRRIGIGIMGLAEYLFAKKIRYGSEAAINSIEYLMRKIRNYCYEASIKLADEKGSFPKFDPIHYMKGHFIRTLPAAIRADIRKYGIRNVTTMAIAPTGTISLLPEVTSSGEPLPFKAYIRNDRIGERAYIHPLYRDMILDGENSPDWFVDSTDLTPTDHLETQSVMQKYVDGAISKTINVPNNTTPDELSRLLLEYMRDLKGVTVYRDGSKEGQILIPISRKESIQALQDENADHNPDIETVQCSTGSCDI
jgi:ribonucleoside-diphosphate reductase alpha chain